MRDRWERLWRRLGAPAAPAGVLDELVRAYSSPGRFYHTLEHVEDCLSVFDRVESRAARPAEVELAIWFHDAVYDTRRDDNELKSAEWAGAVISRAGLGADTAARVSGLILATRHHAEVRDADAQVLVDVDLSILSAEEDVFRRYEENVRKEYSWVPEEIFWRRRAEILRGFLGRPHIYYLGEHREKYEQRARANLARSIARLEGTAGAA